MPIQVPFETLTELYLNLASKYKGSDKVAYARKPSPGTAYEPIVWDEITVDVQNLAAYLVSKGIKKGDTVAILSENRIEWVVVDLALQLLGVINVSLYATLPPNQVEYILNDSQASLFFVSTNIQLKKAVEVFEDCPTVKEVIAFDTPKTAGLLDHKYVRLLDTVLAEGLKLEPKHAKVIHEAAQSVVPEDVSTLIYTSGTTGNPKGAMLTHRNIVSNVKAAHEVVGMGPDDRVLSFLPLCHSFERTAGYYTMIASGTEIYFAESVDTVAKNLTEARPTILISVPRLFERIFNTINKGVQEGSAVKKAIFNWAIGVGEKYAQGKRGLVATQKKLADKLVFNKLKEKTGGRIKFFVSGGAALPPDIGSFFMSAGLPIMEGYGLTETSPVMAVNHFDGPRIGTVGKVITGVTVGIMRLSDHEIIATVSGEDYPTSLTSEAGEILCKGPNVMKGYWKNEEATREMIDKDGWLHTGDVGRFTDGLLQITDRIKHMIVNAGGKNIYPGPIEDMFKTSTWIEQIMVVGEGQQFMAALIVPDADAVEAFASQNDLSGLSREELLVHPSLRNEFSKVVREFSKELASHEKIRDFVLLPEEFGIESGEMTPTMKLKRRVIEQKYADQIAALFPKEV